MRSHVLGPVFVVGCLVAGCGDDSDADASAASGGSSTAGTGVGGASAGGGGHEGGGDAGNGGGGVGGGGGTAGAGGNRVFVTSTKHNGLFGGLTGADAECKARADAAGLGGTWMAWMGDGVDGPVTRFDHSSEPYSRVGGGVIALSWDDLIDGTIGVPLLHDETGTELPATDDMIVFTAVFHTGGNPTPVNCVGWTDASDSLVPTGLATATDTGWTVTAPYFCSEMHHIYCFEQP